MIKVSEPNLSITDVASVNEALRKWEISGNTPIVEEFESKFAAYIGTSYGVSCNSGASALHLALLALDIGIGDEVLVPDLTMIATANAVTYVGAKPVFIDVDPETWCIDPARLEDKITRDTKAIIPVDLYGHPADIDSIIHIADKYDLYIIEDAAEAIGSEYKGKKCGFEGACGCFSFYANKNITTGEGGMVTTHSCEVADKMRALRSHAFGNSEDGLMHFNHTALGYSYRLSGLQAALGCSQMDRIEELIAHKISNAKFYNSFLKELSDKGKLTLPPNLPWAKNTFWYYTILVNESAGINRDQLMKKLLEDGIETRTTFVPLHRQPIYQEDGVYRFSDWIGDTGINLPSSTHLKAEEIMYICECIKKHVAS